VKSGESPRRVLHVITDLYVGGAEAALTRLLSDPRMRDESYVVSLLPKGEFAGPLREAGIPFMELNFRRLSGIAGGMIRLTRLIVATKPKIVQGWMYHGDLAALIAVVLSGRRGATRLAWNIRCSNLDLAQYGPLLRLVVRACALFSSFPDLILANSSAGMEVHRALGYRPRRAEVVPNGSDVDRYRPDPQARAAVRRELGIADEAILLAHVARVDPMKDHGSFLQVMGELPHLRAFIAGAGTESLPTPVNVHRLGKRGDIPRLLAAADFIVSSSAFGEGFSNALAEGMACGLPPIATDVGDATMIVGDTGIVVAPCDPKALARAIRTLAEESPERRDGRGREARARIVDRFSLQRAQGRMREIYDELSAPADGTRASRGS